MADYRVILAFSALAILPAVTIRPAAGGEPLQPREAGARYGQALGAIEVCYGSKLAPKAEGLASAYSGNDLTTFKAEASKIYDAWIKVKGCTNQHDPNQCKVIMDKSCLNAEAEIGANGSAVPGLVDFIKH